MVSKEKLEMYQELAKRNGWNVSIDNNDKNEIIKENKITEGTNLHM